MKKGKTIRLQIKDLPGDRWVELLADDIARIVESRDVQLYLHVRDVPSHAGFRWERKREKASWETRVPAS